MASITERDPSQRFNTYDREISNIFIFQNDYEKITFVNTTGAELTLTGGEIIGRVADGGANNLKGIQLVSTATDGSQFVFGVNSTCVTLPIAGEATITCGIGGDVDKNLLKLTGAETLDTIVALRTIGDKIMAETKGIRLVDAQELNNYDN